MKIIKLVLLPDDEYDEQTEGHADGKTNYIYCGESFVSPDIA